MIACAVLFSAVSFVACDKPAQQTVNNIIVPPRQVNEPDTLIHQMNEVNGSDVAEWMGSEYKVITHRHTSDSLTAVTDNSGKRFRNNVIDVVITRKDGSVFFEKTFTKAAFEKYLSEADYEHSVLLGLVYNGTDSEHIMLLGSVGNPDILTEEFVPFNVKVSKMGEVSIEKAVFKVPNDSIYDEKFNELNEGV